MTVPTRSSNRRFTGCDLASASPDHAGGRSIYPAYVVVFFLLASSGEVLADASVSGPTGTFTNYRPAEAPEGEWDDFLPILGKAAHKKGFDLPKPFGFGINVAYTQRDVKTTDLKVGLNGPPNQDVSGFVTLKPKAKAVAVVARLDVWLFPFLNIYGLGGGLGKTRIRAS